jgi:hypothetical protein
MKPYEVKVVAEQAELATRLFDLKKFIFSETSTYHILGKVERDLLYEQYVVMDELNKILIARIKRFINASIKD